jgi:membrane-bound lytic murein transglycosylase F
MTHLFSHTASALAIAALGLLVVPTQTALSEEWDAGMWGAAGVRCVSENCTTRERAPGEASRSTANAKAPRCERLPGLFRVKHVSHREIQRGYQVDPKKAPLLRRIRETACRFGVDPAIGQGVAWTESRFDPSARSPDGLSSGAFQLTEVTAAQMRSRLRAAKTELPLHDEVTLAMGYLRYLAVLFEKRTVLYRDGLTTVGVADPVECWRFAIAAYNAGEGRVAAAQHRAASLGRNPTRFDDVRPLLPEITRKYVDNVISFGVSQGAEKVQIQATAREAGDEPLAS